MHSSWHRKEAVNQMVPFANQYAELSWRIPGLAQHQWQSAVDALLAG